MAECERPIHDWLEQHAAARGEQPALVCGDEHLSWVALWDRVHAGGVGRRSRVALFGENSIDYAVALLAVARLGAAVAPLPVGLGAAARRRAMRVAGCSAAIGDAAILRAVGEDATIAEDMHFALDGAVFAGTAGASAVLPETVDCAAPYILTMTSGSTGAPKPIVFTQATKLRRAFLATRDVYGLGDDAVVLVSTPMHHSLAQRSALLPLLLGGTAVILPRFSPAAWLDAVRTHRVSFLFAVSSQLRVLLPDLRATTGGFPSLRTIVSSSARLDDATKEELVAILGCDLHECYGTSEIGCATDFSLNDAPDKRSSVGRALPHVTLKICDQRHRALPPGETGEIAVRTRTAFAGYLDDPAATAAAHDADGYFYTGDLGRLDADGWLYFRGRSKEVVITGGINVHPADVEAVIASCPGVSECAVIGVDDAYFGEAILAVVVGDRQRGYTPAAVRRRCAEELAVYQRPMAIEEIAALPRNEMGKVHKPTLRERFRGYDATSRLRALLLREVPGGSGKERAS
ncbi:MAG: class I adenylate-forming enzyme family protein [Planctomycetota bacterium]